MTQPVYTTKILTLKSDDPTMTYHFFRLLEDYPGFPNANAVAVGHSYFCVLEYETTNIHALRVYECQPHTNGDSMADILSGTIDLDQLLFYGTNLYSDVHTDTKPFLRMYDIYETMIQ